MKKIVIICLLLFLLIIIGCTGQNERVETDQDYRVGTEGIEFEAIGLIDELFDDTFFNINVEAQNKGAYDIEEGYALLTLEKDYMCLASYDTGECLSSEENKKEVKLNGKSIVNPQGELTLIEYPIKTYFREKQSEEREVSLLLTMCYEYETELITDICIDPQAFSQSPITKPCEPKTETFSGQGAPIVITEVETKMLPHTKDKIIPQFTITFEDRGNGQAIKEESVSKACSGESIGREEWNQLTLTRIEFMNGEFFFDIESPDRSTIECFPFPFKLKDERDTVRCTVKNQYAIPAEMPAFTTPLYVRVDYGYTQTKSEKITVRQKITH